MDHAGNDQVFVKANEKIYQVSLLTQLFEEFKSLDFANLSESDGVLSEEPVVEFEEQEEECEE